MPARGAGHFKDAVLNDLAQHANVAQFVSFGPDLALRYAWVRGRAPQQAIGSPSDAVTALLAASPERAVNIRSFHPNDAKGKPFLVGIKKAEAVLSQLRQLAGLGLFTIVNETVNVHDGGVSGVAFGDVVEFAPGDTPRCVEKRGTAALPRQLALSLLETVYGFRPALPESPGQRVEFSLHPLRRGFRHDHTILWESGKEGLPPTAAEIVWPNRFSRLLGDKAFGLLIADRMDLPVPRTEVIARGLAPFHFGRPTGLAEVWLRTCPTTQVPGLYTTRRGWIDPFRLLRKEDPTGKRIASVLAQQGVEAVFSGAMITEADGKARIEGVSGRGDDFMIGRRSPEALPKEVRRAVGNLERRAAEALGPVRFEWVFDGAAVWVLQLHRGASATAGRVIFPGEASRYHPFKVAEGIAALRRLISKTQGTGEGIEVVGQIGVTSHLGDLLRRARIPSRIAAPRRQPRLPRAKTARARS